MQITLLIQSIAGLSAILIILVLVLVYTHKNKKPKQEKKEQHSLKPKPKDDWELFLQTLKNKEATTQELQETLDLIVKYHGQIPSKLGIRVNPEFDKYAQAIFYLCRHPNTNKNLILNFDKELERRNSAYKKELNDALTKGLNSIGV